MQRAVYGVYRNGQVILNDHVSEPSESKVIVVFLGEQKPKAKLMDIFTLFGKWEDTRSTEEIVAELRASRTSRKDIQL